MRIIRYLLVLCRKCYHGLLLTALLFGIYLLIPKHYHTASGGYETVRQRVVENSENGIKPAKNVTKNVTKFVTFKPAQINISSLEKEWQTSVKASNASNITRHNTSIAELDTGNCSTIKCNRGTCFEDLTCYRLPPFETQYKNPCFYEKIGEDDSDQSIYKNLIIRRMVTNLDTPQVQNFHQYWQSRRKGKTKQLRCLPYFFLIGMEKCGTTDLYQRISIHPHIVLSPAKELQWWTRRRFFYQKDDSFPGKLQSDEFKLRHIPSLVNVPLRHYYAFFDKAAETIKKSENANSSAYVHHMITGDGSPNILYWNDFAEIFSEVDSDGPRNLVASQIGTLLPDARLICILRNPTDRLYSSYLFFNRGVTKHSFHHVVTKGLKLFDNCMQNYSLRYCTYSWELKERVGSTVNLMQGLYSVMVQDWLKVFNRTQFHVVHFETYKKTPLVEVNKIFRILDIPTLAADSVEAQKIERKSPAFVGKQYRRVGSMLHTTRQLLDNFYSTYNSELAQLLKDDRFLWKN